MPLLQVCFSPKGSGVDAASELWAEADADADLIEQLRDVPELYPAAANEETVFAIAKGILAGDDAAQRRLWDDEETRRNIFLISAWWGLWAAPTATTDLRATAARLHTLIEFVPSPTRKSATQMKIDFFVSRPRSGQTVFDGQHRRHWRLK